MDKKDKNYKYYVSDQKIDLFKDYIDIPKRFIKYKDVHGQLVRNINKMFSMVENKVYFYCLEKKKNKVEFLLCIPIYYDTEYDLDFDYFLKKKIYNDYAKLSNRKKDIIKCFLKKYYGNEIGFDDLQKEDDLGVIIDDFYNLLDDDNKEKFLNYVFNKVVHAKVNDDEKKKLLTVIRSLKRIKKKEKIKRK